jgi:hypothetical protein
VGVPVLGRPGPRYDATVLDERDLEIIATLQEDARATYADVGRRVGLSASAVHERVRTSSRRTWSRIPSRCRPEPGLFVTALIA